MNYPEYDYSECGRCVGPVGTKGDAGPAGEPGLSGAAGDQGDPGTMGERGVQGICGPQGDKGYQGPVGPEGESGPNGPAGPKGALGPTGTEGNVGVRGNAGPKGESGPQGLAGPKGNVGLAGVRGPAGNAGPRGMSGPMGPQGLQGLDGVQGPGGKQGPQGFQGDRGYIGERGPTGPLGDIGPIGPDGPVGLAGPPGDIGILGDTGETGTLQVGTVSTVAYDRDNPPNISIVNSGDSSDAVLDFTLVAGPEGQQGMEGQQGEKGAQGSGLLLRGSYATYQDLLDAHPTAAPGDAYLVQGMLYFWRPDATEWTEAGDILGARGIVGEQGDTGGTGDTGPQGDTGDTGPQGETGDTGSAGPAGDTGAQGIAGVQGPQGVDGTGLYFKGAFDSIGELPSPGADGDAYFVDQVLYVWNTGDSSSDWKAVATLEGPAGIEGVQGVTGETGDTGQSGPTGPTGPEGPTGPTGVVGPRAGIAVAAEEPALYQLEITGEPAVFTTPNLMLTPVKYDADLSSSGNVIEVPVGNVIYRLRYSSTTALALYLAPRSGAVRVDVKRSTQYDSAEEGQQWDDYNLSGQLTIDAIIYNRSNEKHTTRIRQQDPVSGLWSLCDVIMYSSKNGGRVTIWVEWIEVNVAFS